MAFPSNVRALLFDVFGTVVDWRSTVTNGLYEASKNALQQSSIPSDVRQKATDMRLDDWGRFAQEWRNSYLKYCASRAADASLPVATIDEHHHQSLQSLLGKWGIENLWNVEEVHDLSLIWHRLTPWSDSEQGLALLSARYPTCTLSNGNFSLLEDLRSFGKLKFSHIFSAEAFGTFKPNKAVYLGGAEKLGLRPEECALVAAHLGDLKAAKDCGFSAIYVERAREEGWNKQKIEQAKADGWVDLWVREDEDGFITVNQKLRQPNSQL